jgi:hypothetical protein
MSSEIAHNHFLAIWAFVDHVSLPIVLVFFLPKLVFMYRAPFVNSCVEKTQISYCNIPHMGPHTSGAQSTKIWEEVPMFLRASRIHTAWHSTFNYVINTYIKHIYRKLIDPSFFLCTKPTWFRSNHIELMSFHYI